MNIRTTSLLTCLSLRRLNHLVVAVVAAIAMPILAFAQTGTGTVTGRVLNTGSGEYVRNVEVRIQGTNIATSTVDGGYYYLNGVPAGNVTIVATYPGADAVSAPITVTAGATITRDLEFALSGTPGGEIVKLGAIVVETEREGQSKMVAEQKQAMNVKEVVSTDNFGDMSEQNVGEFLKYLPGINIDYVETDTRAASLGGMDPKYGYVTIDGNTMASGDSGSFGDNSRQFEFESISMNNIESVEVNKTLTPDMWGDAPAGTVNLRSRSALDMKHPKFGFQAGFITNALESGSPFKRTPRHDDGLHAKTRPRLSFDYTTGPILGGKIGITFNGSFTNIYKLQYRETLSYDYTSTSARAWNTPLVTAVNYKDGPKISEKSAGGVKVDYEPFRGLRLTTAAAYSYFSDFFANRNLNFVTNTANLGVGSSLTKVIANNSNNTNTRVDQSGETTGKQKDNTYLAFMANWRRGPWIVDMSLAFSRSRETRGSSFYGTIGNTPTRLSRIGFTAERPSVTSTSWNIVQTSGGNWYDWNNWGVNSGDAQDLNTNRQIGETDQYTIKLDASRAMSWKLPDTIKFGVAENVMPKRRWVPYQYVGRFVGPTGNSLTSHMPLSKATFNIDKGWGGGIGPLPVVDKEAMYTLLRDHPEYFTQSTGNLVSQINAVGSSFQSTQEDVRAAYVMDTVRIGKLQLLGGVRVENTRTATRVPDEVAPDKNPFVIRGTAVVNGVTIPTYTVPTSGQPAIDYANYRWSKGNIQTWGEYTDYLPSFAAKYQVTPSFDLKLGYNKSIKRPNLSNTAGGWDISTNTDTGEIDVTIPNPNLKPERSDRISLMGEYYFKNAGVASVHVYQSHITNAVDTSDEGLTASQVGLDDQEFAGYVFHTFVNLDQIRTVRGIELEYRQQLRFLPSKYLRGTQIWGTYSQRSATPRPYVGTRFVPRVASGGITWSYAKYYLQVNGTWTDETFTGSNSVSSASIVTPGQMEYLRPRLIAFVSARYRLTHNLSLFISGDRAYDSGKIWYYHSDGRFRQIEKYGSQWSFGISGNY
jgi:iron complex outermembrane recepter protein